MKAFMSYFSDEETDAEDISTHLRTTFSKAGLQVFMASSWDSIAPGDQWEAKVLEGLGKANVLIVLMSHDALTRPWINFEIGVAWAKEIRIILLCHRGMTPNGLPSPYSSLQAIDLNGVTHAGKLEMVKEAVARALNISVPREGPASLAEPLSTKIPFSAALRAWNLRPDAHVGAKEKGRFLVGTVSSSRADRAEAAGLNPGETVFVRLFLGTRPEGRYINALASGDSADFFERAEKNSTAVDAEIRVAASYHEEALDSRIPIFVVDSVQAATNDG